jgi:ribonuclease BN (tRNA processing enzyme)
MQRVREVIAQIEPHDSAQRYSALGVDVIGGHARIVNPWTVEITGAGPIRRLSTRAIVIATGAQPVVPQWPGLADVDPVTSDTLWDRLAASAHIPQRIAIFGGGAIGCELAQALARLGAHVTLIERGARLLAREDEDVSAVALKALQGAGVQVLLDCGLFQGYKLHRERNWADPGPLREAEAIVISHAHLDHSGWLPALVKHGWRGPVYVSPGTRDLLKVLLLDSAHLQEEDARRANRYGFSRHEKALPLYTRADALRALALLVAVPPGRAFRPDGALSRHSLSFTPVGHLLGACAVTLQEPGRGGRRLVFSGDVGRSNDLLMPAPQRVTDADVLLVESSYGNRVHPKDDASAQLV